MLSAKRDFLEKYSTLWAQRAGDRRASGTPLGIRIADALESIVRDMRAELAALQMPAADETERITWKSPVFNAGGRFNPFAGTKREGWLASADVCERLGCPDVAAAYRRMAADVGAYEIPASSGDGRPAAALDRAPTRPPPRRARSTWIGAPMPPPEPTPFAAGPQMSFL